MNTVKPFLQEFRQPSTSFSDIQCSQSSSGSPISYDFEEFPQDIHLSYSKPLSSVARICYPFFISHLHNPYPTLEEKESLLKESGTSDITLTNISNWFANSRRRCRWIDICNEYFAGDSKRMVIACERVLNPNIPEAIDHPPLPPSAVNAILSMQKRVRGWHEAQTEPCSLVAELCEIMDSYSLEDKELIEIGYRVLTGQDLGSPYTHPQKLLTPCLYAKQDGSPNSIKRKAGSLLEDDNQLFESPTLALGISSPSSSSSHSNDPEYLSRTPSLTWSLPTDDEEERPPKRSRSESSTSPRPETPSSLYSMQESPLKAMDDLLVPFVFGNTDDPTPFTLSIPWDFQDSMLLQNNEPLELNQDPTSTQPLPKPVSGKRMRTSDEMVALYNETDIRPPKRLCLSHNTDSVSKSAEPEIPRLIEPSSTEVFSLLSEPTFSLDFFNESLEESVPNSNLLGDGQPLTDMVTNFVDVSFWSQFLEYTDNQPSTPSRFTTLPDQFVIPDWGLDDSPGIFEFDLSTLSDERGKNILE